MEPDPGQQGPDGSAIRVDFGRTVGAAPLLVRADLTLSQGKAADGKSGLWSLLVICI